MMADVKYTRNSPPPSCAWCGGELQQQSRGRPRKYCSPACKQRAYEQRHNIVGTPIPEGAVILNPARADELRDELYELRCIAEDISTAHGEGASPAEISQLCAELVTLATRIEKIR